MTELIKNLQVEMQPHEKTTNVVESQSQQQLTNLLMTRKMKAICRRKYIHTIYERHLAINSMFNESLPPSQGPVTLDFPEN
jgi:hypothetical protein